MIYEALRAAEAARVPSKEASRGRLAVGAGRPQVLMYHAIADVPNDPNRICVSPRRFEAQMGYLERRGLRGVSMRELLRATAVGRADGLVGLTFDDGYENFLRSALPTLESFGFSATLFVVGGMLGGDNAWDEEPRMKLLGEDGVREAARRGTEIGSHGMTHAGLSGIQTPRLERELGESRRVLGEVLGETVDGFCYPYGSLDGAAVRAARRAGYSYACACWTRAAGDAHDLPRMPVWNMDRPWMLAAKLRAFPLYSEITTRLSKT